MAVRYYGGGNQVPAGPSAVRVQRVEQGTSILCRMLSDSIGGVFTHHVRDRSHYCAGDECDRSMHRSSAVWKGYVAAEVFRKACGDWLPVVLEITESLELDMRGVYARGQVWEVSREKETSKKKKPLVGRLVRVDQADKLRAAFDVRLVLYHLFHVTQIDLSARNPLPPRLVLEPTPDENPPKKKETP